MSATAVKYRLKGTRATPANGYGHWEISANFFQFVRDYMLTDTLGQEKLF